VRHLTPGFAISALERGSQIEQFLGGDSEADPPSIRWVTVYAAGDQFQVTLHEAEDVGTDDFADVAEFPPLDSEEDTGEGRVIARAAAADEALAAAYSANASRSRSVGQRRCRLG
jgi:hypothetical protein